MLDADGHLAETDGECKQGIGLSYDGRWSYHPLIVSLRHTQEPLYLKNRSGNRPSHEGAAFYLDAAATLCDCAGFRRITFCGDTDFSQTRHLDAWHEAGRRFIFGLDAQSNLVRIANELPASAWRPLPREAKGEIVRRVDALFALADQIESRLRTATARVEKITQAILAKAFRGELVPTEAELARIEGRDYEPASVLLERIRRERETARPAAPAKRTRANPAETAKPKTVTARLSRGAYLKRGAVASYAVARLHKLPTFGQTQLEKILYLAEAHLGIDLEGRPARKVAGPFDPCIYKLESVAAKSGWFTTHERARVGRYYRPGPKITDRITWAERTLGSKRAEMDRLLGWSARMKTEQAEIFATVFAAWNDFLLDGRKPTDEQIIREVRENWHESKQRFKPKQLQNCLDWMRKRRFVPHGKGPST